VPAPAEVEVILVDEESGEEIRVEKLYWQPPPVEGITATPLLPVSADPSTGRVTLRGPAGRLQVKPTDMTIAIPHGAEEFDCVPGHNVVRIPAFRRIGVRFHFMDGDAEIPWSWSWRLRAQHPTESTRDIARSIGVLWFKEPGPYELFSDEGMPGYASIDGTAFEVRAPFGGEPTQELTVELTPE
jgi:hypothetical protein